MNLRWKDVFVPRRGLLGVRLWREEVFCFSSIYWALALFFVRRCDELHMQLNELSAGKGKNEIKKTCIPNTNRVLYFRTSLVHRWRNHAPSKQHTVPLFHRHFTEKQKKMNKKIQHIFLFFTEKRSNSAISLIHRPSFMFRCGKSWETVGHSLWAVPYCIRDGERDPMTCEKK